MKCRRFLFLAICFIIFVADKGLAQDQRKIDSMKQLLRSNLLDTVRVDTYANLSWIYASTHTKLDTAKLYADSIQSFSEKINYQAGVALSHSYNAIINRFGGNYHQSLKHMEKYVAYHELKGNRAHVAYGLYEIGVLNFYLENYVQSLTAYQKVLDFHKENKSKGEIAKLLHAIAHVQRNIDKREAIKSYEKAIVLWEQINDQEGITISTEGIGNAYDELKEYDKAEYYLLKALAMAKKEKRPIGIASVANNLGIMYGKMGNYKKALKYHLVALDIREKLASKDNLAKSLTKIGDTYAKLGEIDLAKNYLFKSLEIAKEIQISALLRGNYKALMELNESTNNITEAFKYQKLYMIVKDSIFNSEKRKQLIELENKYETVQKDKEIIVLIKEKEVQQVKTEQQATFRNALIGGILLLAAIAGLIIYTLRQRLKNQKLVAAKNEEIKISNLREQLGTLEMKALRAQMNPHFLFNCMNSINRMILSEDNDNASKYLTKFSKLVRLMLENSENPKVTLKDELAMLKSYIELEAIRFKGKINYSIDVDETIDKEASLIPSMILQPFVENAIWHGLLHTNKAGELTITIKEEKDHLLCSITDNGVGREASLKLQKKTKLKKKSLGIKITTDRLKLLTKEKIKEVINIIDLKDEDNNALGTQVDILIPIS